jgi:hypothetical protein
LVNFLSSYLQIKLIFLSFQPVSTLADIQPKPAVKYEGDNSESDDSPDGKKSTLRPIVTNNHAYEAFLNKKEEKPKTTSGGSSNVAFEPSGVRPRKPCNCTKSQCLKL